MVLTAANIATLTQPDEFTVRTRLYDHFRLALGAVPQRHQNYLIITKLRDQPGWDGTIRPIQGVTGPDGAVLSVSPQFAHLFEQVDVAGVFADAAMPNANVLLAERLGIPLTSGLPVLRWSEGAAPVPELGEWVEPDDPRLPDWLRPFNGGVLIAFDRQGEYRAGVGLKRHNRFASEISVGTDPDHRGRGLATRLIKLAAQHVIEAGGVPLYHHSDTNKASAGAADSAGFPDRGWRALIITPAPTPPTTSPRTGDPPHTIDG